MCRRSHEIALSYFELESIEKQYKIGKASAAYFEFVLFLRGLRSSSPNHLLLSCLVAHKTFCNSELELCLDLPSSGQRAYETKVPLPTSQYDEEGMYYLLSLISFRKISVDINESVGYSNKLKGFSMPRARPGPPSGSYGAVIANALTRQLDDWYQNLPGPVKFPLNDDWIFDVRKARLRCQYFIHRTMSLEQGLRECVNASRAFLKAGEEILTQTSLIAHLALRGYFAMAMILALVHSSTLHASEDEIDDDEKLLRQAHRCLSNRKEVPFLRVSMVRLDDILRWENIL
ncbi:uncharacterized protein Z519_05867 [Cladophialophora bantiana CBS 173.52]|uniref:Transcription factor domain-containing protein n=1 Tax=Cladophialophora bantiana (strain ATCC 10958 / CBS 173.52 / CDC B-1940 / NIH 8579) TaxID=1442370 RepID=A0A0D2G3K9_CLAB1|nr:uncharacterized protein Z519_05867 [Cladophialophora bantiana CBS 173.52]KIW93262.1 hypothetical protein Z519_05867 [Cladophialophora bantiana CBS 173.52]